MPDEPTGYARGGYVTVTVSFPRPIQVVCGEAVDLAPYITEALAEAAALRARIIEGFAIGEALLGEAHTYSNCVTAGPLTGETLLRAYHEVMRGLENPWPMAWHHRDVWRSAVDVGLVDAHLAPPAVEHAEALVDLARSNRETDFRDLAAAVGVPPGDIDELWRGARARLEGRPR